MDSHIHILKYFTSRSRNLYLANKLAQKSFASPGKKCSTSKTEDTEIIMYVWPYAFEC